MDRVLILLAAGRGERAKVEKQWATVQGMPVVAHTLSLCERERMVDRILLGVSPSRLSLAQEMVKKYAPDIGEVFVGGHERRDTVWNGLQRLPKGTGLVMIHDAARPFASKELWLRVINKAEETGAAIPAVPVRDTIKEVVNGQVVKTMKRDLLWAVQTPQAFSKEIIVEGYRMAIEKDLPITDDASAVELLGHPVVVVHGDPKNEKITFAEDLERYRASSPDIRVGWGFDAHSFCPDRPLFLCGVEIPHSQGLEGHSDADVALHALCDALIGAAGMGDIGVHFPDTDERHKGRESSWFVRRVVEMLEEKGFSVLNADITIIAQTPKLSSYRQQMRERVAQLLSIPVERVNIKATTTEGMGFVGRKEGIAAAANVALVAYVG